MANLAVPNFPRTGPAVLTDLVGGARSPFAVGDDLKLTIQEVLDAINVLSGSAALAASDVLGGFQGGAAKKVSVQLVYNAIDALTAAGALAGTDELAAFQTTGKKATLAQVLTYIQNNISTVLNLNGSAFVIVGGNANSTTNGTNLVAAYAAAKLATPHGLALGNNNRFTIFLLPGVYTLTGGALVFDTNYIDLVGLSTNSGSMYWDTGGFATLNGGDTQLQSTGNTLTINAGIDTTIQNLALLTSTAGTRAFNPAGTLALQFQMINVFVQNTSAQTNAAMAADVSYEGYYQDVRCWNTSSFASRVAGTANAIGVFVRCKAAQFAFGGSNASGSGNATGVFIDCEADGGSFGRNNASGKFLRCRFIGVVGTANGMFAWDTGGAASGTFIDCEGNTSSCFGLASAAGTFLRCTSGAAAFGFGGSAGGLFEYCSCVGAAGTNSFGGTSAAGTFRYCEVTAGLGFSASATANGLYEWCRCTSYGFGGWSGTGGTFSGTARHCSTGAQGFGMGATGAGTLSGTVENCSMVGHGLVTLTGKITNMRIESVAANTTALQIGTGSTGAIYNCTIVGTGSGLSIDVISGTPTIVIAHCRLNKGIGAGITNSIGTPYNVDDTDIV